MEDITPVMERSNCVYGYFTAKVEGNPKVAFIERHEATDPDWIEEGITTFYVVKHNSLNDHYLWNEEDLKEFMAKSAWAWDFHKKEN